MFSKTSSLGGIMKRCLLVVVFFLSSFLSAHTPITHFSYGHYIGNSHYHSNDGTEADAPVHAVIGYNDIHVDYVRNEETVSYHYNFDFNADGTFGIVVTKHADESTHVGTGYCMSYQCHFYVELTNGYLEETITFHPNEKIYKVGSLNITVDEVNKVIRWEDELYKVEEDQ